MLYIKRVGGYFINLKTDLVKYNGCYDRMMGYILWHCFTVKFLEVPRFCETINILLNEPRVFQVVNREGHAKNCFSFLLAFMEECSAFLWKLIGDTF